MKKFISAVLSTVLSLSMFIGAIHGSELTFSQQRVLYDGNRGVRVTYQRQIESLEQIEIHGVRLGMSHAEVQHIWGLPGEHLGGGWYAFRVGGYVEVYEGRTDCELQIPIIKEVEALHAAQFVNGRTVGIYTNMAYGRNQVPNFSYPLSHYSLVALNNLEYSLSLLSRELGRELEFRYGYVPFDAIGLGDIDNWFRKDCPEFLAVLALAPFTVGSRWFMSFDEWERNMLWLEVNRDLRDRHEMDAHRFMSAFDPYAPWRRVHFPEWDWIDADEVMAIEERWTEVAGRESWILTYMEIFYPDDLALFDFRTQEDFYLEMFGHLPTRAYNPVLFGTGEMTLKSALFDEMLFIGQRDSLRRRHFVPGEVIDLGWIWEHFIDEGWGIFVPHFNNWR